jgi:DNA-directed RNA polymerase specialized sigma24 family protein
MDGEGFRANVVKEGPNMPHSTARTTRSKSKPAPHASAESGATPSVRDRLRHAIVKNLTMQDRLLLVLVYAEGMSPDEIAVTLDLAPSQVEVIKERIVNQLGSLVHSA